MREAPSLTLIADLLAAGASVTAYDPVAMHEAQRVLDESDRITYTTNPNDALTNADALVIVTERKEFRSPDFQLIKQRLKQPPIVDGWNLYDPVLVRAMGLDYLAIGR